MTTASAVTTTIYIPIDVSVGDDSFLKASLEFDCYHYGEASLDPTDDDQITNTLLVRDSLPTWVSSEMIDKAQELADQKFTEYLQKQ